MKKLLFISHDASLTGAPILLLNLIRLLKEEGIYQFKIVIKNEYGDLIQDFSKLGETLVWRHSKKNNFEEKLKSLFLGGNKNEIRIQKWINESDVIMSNTITNGDFFKFFDFSKVPLVVSYIHELEIATHYYTSQDYIDRVKLATKKFAAPSEAVTRHLISNQGVNEKDIFRLNYYIPNSFQPKIENDNTLKVFTVGVLGTLDWRKGGDILPIVVAHFFKKHPDAALQFIWKGVNFDHVEYTRVVYELKKLKLTEKVKFEPPSKNVADFYASINVLLLISKEDPYPLVVLEAASFSKPCICFIDSGGAPEFVANDAGDTIPYLDIEMLTQIIFSYYKDRNKCLSKGKAAYEKYNSLHMDKDLILDQVSKIFNGPI